MKSGLIVGESRGRSGYSRVERAGTQKMATPDFKAISVECYSGFKANERPVAFTYGGERREILEITDRWYEGGVDSGRDVVDYFRVKTADGTTWLLRYQTGTDSWLLCL